MGLPAHGPSSAAVWAVADERGQGRGAGGEALVLRTWPFHEADLLVSLFTREHGRVKGWLVMRCGAGGGLAGTGADDACSGDVGGAAEAGAGAAGCV